MDTSLRVALDGADSALDLDALPLELLVAESRELEDSLARLQADDYSAFVDSSSSSTLLLGTAADPFEATPACAQARARDNSASTSPFSHSSANSSSSTDAESDLPTTDSNPSRRRVKQELEFLRERVAGLEATLRELQQTPTQTTTMTSTATSDVATRAELTPRRPDPWEGVAARQREMRQRAEHENAKLRASLQSQLQLAKSLERLLRKRPSLWTDDAQASKRPSTASRESAASTDAAIFASLRASVDESYASYRETLTVNGLWTAACGFRATTAKPTTLSVADDSGGSSVAESVCVELADAKHMPFALDATCRAAWRAITSEYMHVQHQVYEGFQDASDVLALSYDVRMTRKRLSVDFHARAVMKRFVESDDCVVFVWESLSDTAGAASSSAQQQGARSGNGNGDSDAPGIRVQECGWTVFLRHPASCEDIASAYRSNEADEDTSSCETAVRDTDSTRVLTCMRMTPLVSASSSCASTSGSLPKATKSSRVASESRQVGVLTSLSLDYFGEQLDDAQRAIESLALDDARQMCS